MNNILKEVWEKTYDYSMGIWQKAEGWLEDKSWKEINLFTGSKEGTTATKEEVITTATEATQKIKEEIDFQKSEILSKVKTDITSLFNKLKNTIESNDVLSSKVLENWKTYVQLLNEKYNSIIEKLNKCKNDWELYKIYQDIRTEVVLLNKELSDIKPEAFSKEEKSKLASSDILSVKDDTIKWLENLKDELTRFDWSEEYVKAKKETEESRKKEDNWIEQTLIDIWIPAWIAWLIAWFLWLFWFKWDSKEGWFFASFKNILKDPVNWLLSLVWLWKKDENQVASNEEKIKTWKIEENWDIIKYINWKLEIKIAKKKISYVKIDWKNYKLNLDDVWDISISKRDNKDYIMIWKKEIDLFTFIWQIREQNDTYTLSQNFSEWKDLKVEIA